MRNMEKLPEIVKVKDHDSLVRNTKTQAVINTDRGSLEEYRKRRDSLRKNKDEINTLKSEVSEIKDMLRLLIEKIK